MSRRELMNDGLTLAAALSAGITGAEAAPIGTTTASEAFEDLPSSPRMPTLFVGHGSPMNAISDNAYSR